jgi:virulence-associated protein VagC
MKTAEVIDTTQGQTVRLPAEFRLPPGPVSVRWHGDALVLEPSPKSAHWPDGFFEAIAIRDPSFVRPPQGAMPPAAQLD